jgi:hypothetical protein
MREQGTGLLGRGADIDKDRGVVRNVGCDIRGNPLFGRRPPR